MILKANLAACFLFFVGVLGIVSLVDGLRWPPAEDAVWLLAFTSPVAIWSAGAWILRRRRRVSFVWLAASIVLMAAELVGIYTDVDAARQEKRSGEETMHLAAFVAMLLQWFMALVLLAVIGGLRLFTRSSLPARPR